MSSQRVISKGECSVELLGLDLYRCTEQITHISLSQYKKVRWNTTPTDTFNNKSVLVEYAKRRKDITLSLNDYFYKYFSAAKSEESTSKLFLNGTLGSCLAKFGTLLYQMILTTFFPLHQSANFTQIDKA